MEELIYGADDIIPTSVKVAEQETVVQFDRNGAVATIWTNDSTVLTKLKKLLIKAPDQWKLVDVVRNKNGEPTGYFFECPKKLVRFGVPKVYTEEHKEKLRANAERIHFGKRPAMPTDDDEDDDGYNDSDTEI